jgi:hypothetical protein
MFGAILEIPMPKLSSMEMEWKALIGILSQYTYPSSTSQQATALRLNRLKIGLWLSEWPSSLAFRDTFAALPPLPAWDRLPPTCRSAFRL